MRKSSILSINALIGIILFAIIFFAFLSFLVRNFDIFSSQKDAVNDFYSSLIEARDMDENTHTSFSYKLPKTYALILFPPRADRVTIYYKYNTNGFDPNFLKNLIKNRKKIPVIGAVGATLGIFAVVMTSGFALVPVIAAALAGGLATTAGYFVTIYTTNMVSSGYVALDYLFLSRKDFHAVSFKRPFLCDNETYCVCACKGVDISKLIKEKGKKDEVLNQYLQCKNPYCRNLPKDYNAIIVNPIGSYYYYKSREKLGSEGFKFGWFNSKYLIIGGISPFNSYYSDNQILPQIYDIANRVVVTYIYPIVKGKVLLVCDNIAKDKCISRLDENLIIFQFTNMPKFIQNVESAGESIQEGYIRDLSHLLPDVYTNSLIEVEDKPFLLSSFFVLNSSNNKKRASIFLAIRETDTYKTYLKSNLPLVRPIGDENPNIQGNKDLQKFFYDFSILYYDKLHKKFKVCSSSPLIFLVNRSKKPLTFYGSFSVGKHNKLEISTRFNVNCNGGFIDLKRYPGDVPSMYISPTGDTDLKPGKQYRLYLYRLNGKIHFAIIINDEQYNGEDISFFE